MHDVACSEARAGLGSLRHITIRATAERKSAQPHVQVEATSAQGREQSRAWHDRDRPGGRHWSLASHGGGKRERADDPFGHGIHVVSRPAPDRQQDHVVAEDGGHDRDSFRLRRTFVPREAVEAL